MGIKLSQLSEQDWAALGRLAAAPEPLLSLSWAANGVAERLIEAGFIERVRQDTGLPYLSATWSGRREVVRWLRQQITPSAHEALILFQSGHRRRLDAKAQERLVKYGLIVNSGILSITPLGALVVTAPPAL